jgi:uncharacterized protein (TIGR03790 family)
VKVTAHPFIFLFLLILSFISIRPAACWALRAEQVLVVANEDAWYSCELARYYMKKRNIPPGNLIQLKAPSQEDCSREDYEKYIASPIRDFLKKNDPGGDRFRCLVTMYGIPLRVHPPKLKSGERKELSRLKNQYDSIHKQIKKSERQKDNHRLTLLGEAETQIKKQIDRASKIFQAAAVDSELALVREDSHPLDGWLPNKYFLGYRGRDIKNMPEKVMRCPILSGRGKWF